MRLRTIGWRIVPAAVAATVLAFGVAGLASAQVNDPPAPQNDTATTNEDTPVTIAVLANDTDPNGDTLTIASVANGSKGTTAISGDHVVYTPNANANGVDAFIYTVSDSALLASATVTVTIIAVNDAPVAVNDTVTTLKDTAKVIAVLANDSDVDGDALTVTSVSAPGHGTAVITDAGTKVTYTPAAGFVGADAFIYVISDGALSATGTVNITVQEQVVPQGTHADVVAACQTFSSLDRGINALCNLYLSGQLPAWAQENIGRVILKRVGQLNKAEIICATTTSDATLTALCALYTNPDLPAWLKRDVGKVIERLVKVSASASGSASTSISLLNPGKGKHKGHDGHDDDDD